LIHTLQHQEETPQENVDSEIFSNGKPLHQQIGRKGPHQEAEIENT
jgi:hypothetical protein